MNGKRIPDEAYFIEQILDSSGKNRTSKELRDKEHSNTEEFGNTEEYEIHTFNKLCRGESVNQMHHLYYQCHFTTNRDPYFMLGILESRVILYLYYFQSQKRLYIHKCPSVCLSVSHRNPTTA